MLLFSPNSDFMYIPGCSPLKHAQDYTLLPMHINIEGSSYSKESLTPGFLCSHRASHFCTHISNHVNVTDSHCCAADKEKYKFSPNMDRKLHSLY